MKQAISGVAPPQLGEVTVMTVWPSIAASPMGRRLGRLYGIRSGLGLLTVGKLMMLATIPLALALFIISLAPPVPFFGRFNQRYRLTNRRVMKTHDRLTWKFWYVIPHPSFIFAEISSFVGLDRFDTIEVLVLPGQEWYPAGDLVFKRGNVETFRLEGVPRPETFRQTCLKARMSYAGVSKATGRQLVAV